MIPACSACAGQFTSRVNTFAPLIGASAVAQYVQLLRTLYTLSTTQRFLVSSYPDKTTNWLRISAVHDVTAHDSVVARASLRR